MKLLVLNVWGFTDTSACCELLQQVPSKTCSARCTDLCFGASADVTAAVRPELLLGPIFRWGSQLWACVCSLPPLHKRCGGKKIAMVVTVTVWPCTRWGSRGRNTMGPLLWSYMKGSKRFCVHSRSFSPSRLPPSGSAGHQRGRRPADMPTLQQVAFCHPVSPSAPYSSVLSLPAQAFPLCYLKVVINQGLCRHESLWIWSEWECDGEPGGFTKGHLNPNLHQDQEEDCEATFIPTNMFHKKKRPDPFQIP